MSNSELNWKTLTIPLQTVIDIELPRTRCKVVEVNGKIFCIDEQTAQSCRAIGFSTQDCMCRDHTYYPGVNTAMYGVSERILLRGGYEIE